MEKNKTMFYWLLGLGITFLIGAILICIEVELGVSNLAVVGIVLPIWAFAFFLIYLGIRLKKGCKKVI